MQVFRAFFFFDPTFGYFVRIHGALVPTSVHHLSGKVPTAVFLSRKNLLVRCVGEAPLREQGRIPFFFTVISYHSTIIATSSYHTIFLRVQDFSPGVVFAL